MGRSLLQIKQNHLVAWVAVVRRTSLQMSELEKLRSELEKLCCCDNMKTAFPSYSGLTLAKVQSRDAWIRREDTQSVLGTLRDSRSSERSLRGRRLDLQLGHGTQIERYPAKCQNSEYLSIACMKTYDL